MNKFNTLKNKIEVVENKFNEAEAGVGGLFEDFIPFINDYDKKRYYNWMIVPTTDGFCFNDGDLIDSPLQLVLNIIKTKGSVNMRDILDCAI